jgi:redox-sensitive bicupin YhaK (pirin superfamily)
MNLRILRSSERGGDNHGWLDTRHTFSFADYYDPAWMNYRALRVLNEDIVAPAQGFGMHPHRDMEIVTVVREGILAHADSLGHKATIRPGEVQRITAGTGIWHSEMNPSATEPVHLFQLWVMPDRKGLTPGYDQKVFDPAGRRNALQLIVSPDGADGSLTWHQDARLYLADLEAGKTLTVERDAGRHTWLQVMRGSLTLDGQELVAGDGVAIEPGPALELASRDGVDLLLFDLA